MNINIKLKVKVKMNCSCKTSLLCWPPFISFDKGLLVKERVLFRIASVAFSPEKRGRMRE